MSGNQYFLFVDEADLRKLTQIKKNTEFMILQEYDTSFLTSGLNLFILTRFKSKINFRNHP